MEDSSEDKLLGVIKHYQNSIIKYSAVGNDTKVLHAIHKLYDMPITVAHLQETGVGRTINSLRKSNGDVGQASKSIVSKWKNMVQQDNSDDEDSKQKDEIDEEIATSVSSEKKHKLKNNYNSDISDYDSKNHQSSEKKYKHRSDLSSNKYKSDHKKEEKSDNHRSSHSSEDKKHRKHEEKSRHKEREKEKDKDKKRKHKEEEASISKRIKQEVENIESERDSEENGRYSQPNESLQQSDESQSNKSLIVEDSHRMRHSKHKKHHKSDKHSTDKDRSKDKHNGHHSKKSSHHDKIETVKIKKEKSDECDKVKIKTEPKDLEKVPTPIKSHHKSRSKSSSSSSKLLSPSKVKKEIMSDDDGIDCGSGASFAEALGMIEPTATIRTTVTKKKSTSSSPTPSTSHSSKSISSTSKKLPSSPLALQSPNLLVSNVKLEPLDINLAPPLPEITTNYKPLPNYSFEASLPGHNFRNMTEEEALEVVITSKTARTKVYSGNKTNWGFVPSLFNICVRVLQDNIDSLEYTGGVPYSILKPVLERATADQLFMSEHHNPYLVEDTNELWELHCKREFRANKRKEMESWREMYMRCLDEREAKLKALTANIKQSQDKSLPVRQTKLAYVDSVVKPPRGIARKQAKYGTNKKPLVTPSSRLNAIASAGNAISVTVPNPGARAASSSAGSMFKPKKAPLMQKALAAIKSRFRR